jgi:hypothetical protein
MVFSIVLLVVYSSLINSTPNKLFFGVNNIDKKSNLDNFYGKWEVYKCEESEQAPGSKSKSGKYLHKIILLKPDLIIFFGDTCRSPLYKIQKVDIQEYLWNNYREHQAANIKQDSMLTIYLSCKEKPTSPYFSNIYNGLMLIEKDKLMDFEEGLFLYLKRIDESVDIVPKIGDTVKCYLGAKCGYTGYVIQGTRKNGTVKHVRPLNKNVPMEEIDKKDIKKEEDSK